MMRAIVLGGGRLRRHKGLPALLEGRVSPSAGRADRFLQFIGKLRCELFELWTRSRKSKGKSRAVQSAVDELISLALLTEFIRQRDHSVVPALKDVVEHLQRPAIRRLYAAMQDAAPLKKGRTTARETEEVKPVPDAHIENVLPLVAAQVRAMIELERLTSMRPGKLVEQGVRRSRHPIASPQDLPILLFTQRSLRHGE